MTETCSTSFKVGKPYSFRNVKPRTEQREYWEASMMDPSGARIDRLHESPEVDALAS